MILRRNWINSLQNFRCYNTVEIDSDHRILAATVKFSFLTTKKDSNISMYNYKTTTWNDAVRNKFQLELSNWFENLEINEGNTNKLPMTSWNKLSMRQHQAFSQRRRKNTNKPWVSTQSLDLLNFEELYAKVAKNTVVRNISYMENYHWTRRYSTCEWQNQQNWTNLCRSWRSQ